LVTVVTFVCDQKNLRYRSPFDHDSFMPHLVGKIKYSEIACRSIVCNPFLVFFCGFCIFWNLSVCARLLWWDGMFVCCLA